MSVPLLLFDIAQLLELQSKQAAGAELPGPSACCILQVLLGRNNLEPISSTHLLSGMGGGVYKSAQ